MGNQLGGGYTLGREENQQERGAERGGFRPHWAAGQGRDLVGGGRRWWSPGLGGMARAGSGGCAGHAAQQAGLCLPLPAFLAEPTVREGGSEVYSVPVPQAVRLGRSHLRVFSPLPFREWMGESDVREGHPLVASSHPNLGGEQT